MKKICSLLLCLAVLLSLPAAALAGYSYVSDTNDSLVFPRPGDYFEEPFAATVTNGRGHGSIYVMPKPEAGHGNLGTIPDGSVVEILAERGGFYFFRIEDDHYGWNGTIWFTAGGTLPEKQESASAELPVSNKGVPLELPKEDEYYKTPFVKVVSSGRSDGPGSIYLMATPVVGNGNVGRVRDDNSVLILAHRDGFYFFQTLDGRQGWNGECMFRDA